MPTENLQLKSHAAELFPFYDTITQELQEVRENISRTLCSDDCLTAEIIDYIRRYQGKMLRPALLLLAGKVCGEISDKHIKFASAIELLHLATLIHDDILDQAHLRRNSSTISQLWGNEPSVLLGDYLLSKVFCICNDTGDMQAASDISNTSQVVCHGELKQCLSRDKWEMTETNYMQIIEMKTASLYELCCRLGAKLAGAADEEIFAMQRYGRHFGCAFQIVDDILDIEGREEQTGKTLGTDLRQYKPTLPVIHYIQHSDSDAEEKLLVLLKEQKTDVHVGADLCVCPKRRADTQVRPYECREKTDRMKIKSLLKETCSLQYAYERAGALMQEARQELEQFANSSASDALAGIADFVVERAC